MHDVSMDTQLVTTPTFCDRWPIDPHIWLLGYTKVSYTQDLQHTKNKQSRKAYFLSKAHWPCSNKTIYSPPSSAIALPGSPQTATKNRTKMMETQLAGQLFHVFADVESWVSLLSRHTSSLVSQQLWVLEVEGEHHRWWIKRILDATMFLWSER